MASFYNPFFASLINYAIIIVIIYFIRNIINKSFDIINIITKNKIVQMLIAYIFKLNIALLIIFDIIYIIRLGVMFMKQFVALCSLIKDRLDDPSFHIPGDGGGYSPFEQLYSISLDAKKEVQTILTENMTLKNEAKNQDSEAQNHSVGQPNSIDLDLMSVDKELLIAGLQSLQRERLAAWRVIAELSTNDSVIDKATLRIDEISSALDLLGAE
jgi:hypothetical protein